MTRACPPTGSIRYPHTETHPTYGTWEGRTTWQYFLLDTGEGLILIDTGLNAETCYLVIERIWESGHDPRDIKKILLTHWHGDHSCNARVLQEMSGAEIWLQRRMRKSTRSVKAR